MANDIGLMKNAEELREFLNNLGIEYRYGCYENKNPEACELLAEYFELVEKNIPKSSKLYQYTCDKYSMGRSCHNAANSMFFGRGIPLNYQKSLDYYSKGCLQGYAVSCFNAGQIHFNEHKEVREIIPRDAEKAQTLFEKGCLLKNPESCSMASYMELSGFCGAKEPNNKKAFEFAELGCKLDELNCCGFLTQAYKHGIGCEKDEEKHKQASEKLNHMIKQLKRANPKLNRLT